MCGIITLKATSKYEICEDARSQEVLLDEFMHAQNKAVPISSDFGSGYGTWLQ